MRRKLPTLQALDCFEAAARHQSYTLAARELALTQGAISRRIASLEAFVGVRLFSRTRHGVALTAAGAAYARQIAGRLDGLERDTLDAMSGAGQGALHIAAVPTFAARWLVPRLARFAAACPEVTVHIDTCTRPFLFSETPYDGALYAGTEEQVRNWPGTRTTLLMHEMVVPIASPAFAARRKVWRPADVARAPLLQQSTRPDAWRQWFEACAVDAPDALRGPRYELFSMLASAAVCGLGVALMPAMLVQAEIARNDLVILCNQPASSRRSYCFVSPEAAQPAAALSSFVQWLQGEIAGDALCAPDGGRPGTVRRST
ncbi:MAG TPA: LysR family transcriptional regulator [Burkholderiaceae bacterium]|nr:LysR family transcriptional regulator [Burkholderiaceae bacterium]